MASSAPPFARRSRSTSCRPRPRTRAGSRPCRPARRRRQTCRRDRRRRERSRRLLSDHDPDPAPLPVRGLLAERRLASRLMPQFCRHGPARRLAAAPARARARRRQRARRAGRDSSSNRCQPGHTSSYAADTAVRFRALTSPSGSTPCSVSCCRAAGGTPDRCRHAVPLHARGPLQRAEGGPDQDAGQRRRRAASSAPFPFWATSSTCSALEQENLELIERYRAHPGLPPPRRLHHRCVALRSCS